MEILTTWKKPPKTGGISTKYRLLFVVLVFALLVSDTAAGLACRLAGGLALTAAALLSGLAELLGFQSLNTFHDNFLSVYTQLVFFQLYHILSVLSICSIRKNIMQTGFSFQFRTWFAAFLPLA